MSAPAVRAAGAVLTGGASRRMGSDKALLDVDGSAMAARVASALAGAGCDPVFAVGGDVDRLRGLGLEVVADLHPGEGPLGGILTALRHLGDGAEALVVVACDLPLVDARAVASLVAGLGDHDVAAALADGPRPLCAAWSPRVAEVLQARFAEGERAVRRAARGLDVVEVELDAATMRNVNTPAELAVVRDEARRGSRRRAGSVPPVTTDPTPIEQVTPDELATALDGGAQVVDVREPAEYEEGHVPGAVLVPLGTVADRLDAFDPDAVTYVICRSGARSMKACEIAAGAGRRVVNVAGGTLGWIASGRDVATGDRPT